MSTSDAEMENDEKDIGIGVDVESSLGNIRIHSPSSSTSSVGSKTTNDTTFEPSVEMMVNDFDDEGTLEEEEKLAEQEAHDPSSELSSLEKESEMPIEELMALYNYVPHKPKKHISRKQKKHKFHNREHNNKKQLKNLTVASAAVAVAASSSSIMLATTSTLEISAEIDGSKKNATKASSPPKETSLNRDLSLKLNDNEISKSDPKKLLKRRLSMCNETERYNQQSDLLTKRDDHIFTPPKKIPPRRLSSALLSSNSATVESDKPVRRRLSDFEGRGMLISPEKLMDTAPGNHFLQLNVPKSPIKRSSAYSSLINSSASTPSLNFSKRGENYEKDSKKQIKQSQKYYPNTSFDDDEKNFVNASENLKCGNSKCVKEFEEEETTGDENYDDGDNDNDNDDFNDGDDDEDDEDDEDDDDDEDEDENEDEDDDNDTRTISSDLRQLYPETYGDKKSRRSDSRHLSDDEDEIDDDYSPEEEEDIKKTIMVGSEFQALIPEGFLKYDDALPYENEDKLLWDPNVLEESVVESFLTSYEDLKLSQQMNGMPSSKSHSSFLNYMKIVEILPEGNHLKDDEQALLLLSQCGHDTDEALRRKCINAVPTADTSIWSTEECRNFESGIRTFGKDFHTIKQQKVRTRAVGEIVQFYYLWKKTDRHDMFANKARLDKKKYSLKPGVTEYMDRFLEEQDNGGSSSNGGTGGLNGVRDRSASPSNPVAGPSTTKLYVGLGSNAMKLTSNNKMSHNISIMNNEKKIHNSINRNNSITGINKNSSNYNYYSHIKNFKGFSNINDDNSKNDTGNRVSGIE